VTEPVRSEHAVTACSEAVLLAPRAAVWQFLLDIPRSTRCLPGVHDVEQVDERTYRGTVRFRAGFLPLTFQATVELSELVPPERIRLAARAIDPLTGEEVTASALAELSELEESRTLLRYAFTVENPGLLGGLGRRMLEEVNRRMIQQFLQCVERELVAADKPSSDR